MRGILLYAHLAATYSPAQAAVNILAGSFPQWRGGGDGIGTQQLHNKQQGWIPGAVSNGRENLLSLPSPFHPDSPRSPLQALRRNRRWSSALTAGEQIANHCGNIDDAVAYLSNATFANASVVEHTVQNEALDAALVEVEIVLRDLDESLSLATAECALLDAAARCDSAHDAFDNICETTHEEEERRCNAAKLIAVEDCHKIRDRVPEPIERFCGCDDCDNCADTCPRFDFHCSSKCNTEYTTCETARISCRGTTAACIAEDEAEAERIAEADDALLACVNQTAVSEIQCITAATVDENSCKENATASHSACMISSASQIAEYDSCSAALVQFEAKKASAELAIANATELFKSRQSELILADTTTTTSQTPRGSSLSDSSSPGIAVGVAVGAAVAMLLIMLSIRHWNKSKHRRARTNPSDSEQGVSPRRRSIEHGTGRTEELAVGIRTSASALTPHQNFTCRYISGSGVRCNFGPAPGAQLCPLHLHHDILADTFAPVPPPYAASTLDPSFGQISGPVPRRPSASNGTAVPRQTAKTASVLRPSARNAVPRRPSLSGVDPLSRLPALQLGDGVLRRSSGALPPLHVGGRRIPDNLPGIALHEDTSANPVLRHESHI